MGETSFRYESNGMPNHALAEKYLIPKDVSSQPFKDDPIENFTIVNSAEYIKESPIDSTFSLFPKYTDTTTDTSLGQIGVIISGAPIFNDYENMERAVVALDDNVTHDHTAFVDECNGHPLQDGKTYHYHGVPKCITEKVDIQGKHSTMIGVLKDGFPIYGDKGENGVLITNEELDKCGGHTGPTPEFSG
jgi:hypothetical protein